MPRTQPDRSVKKTEDFSYAVASRKVEKRKATEDLESSTARKPRKIAKVSKLKAVVIKQEIAPVKDPKSKANKSKPVKPKVVLNTAPTEAFDVFVCGTNEQGGLGLGVGSKPDPVYRPRFNPILSAAGVVQIAAGGMHCVALTKDNKLLSWGVNDLGALGRDTTWDGAWVDPDASNSDNESEDETSGLNSKESTPTEIDTAFFPADTVFTQVAAGDNASFALTDDGLLYGWGTYKSIDGESTFSSTTSIQKLPILIPMPEKITKIAAGSNHALALTTSRAIFAWGMGEKYQLGRRISERNKIPALRPQSVGLVKDITNIGAGADHSFAIHRNGEVYAWGLNNYCQTGIVEKDGDDFMNIVNPTPVPSLRGHGTVTHISGGNHHSIAVTSQGKCLTWGRVNNFATGLKPEDMPSQDVILDSRGKPGILQSATQVPNIDAVYATAGSDHCIAIARDGKAYSWGFNARGQAGQGGGDANEEVEQAMVVDNTAVRGKILLTAGAGGQYSVMMGRKGRGLAANYDSV